MSNMSICTKGAEIKKSHLEVEDVGSQSHRYVVSHRTKKYPETSFLTVSFNAIVKACSQAEMCQKSADKFQVEEECTF